MANLYGVANSPGMPTLLSPIAGSDVACSNDVVTTVGTIPALVAPSQGYFYAMVWAGFVIGAGATPPSGLTLELAIGAGSYVVVAGVAPSGLTASVNNNVFLMGVTAASQSAWQGAGSTVRVGLFPGAQSITVRQQSWAYAVLLRAPDQ